MIEKSAEFKHQSVRDLAWAISSPPLILQQSHCCAWPESGWYQRIYQQSLPWLNQLDVNPDALETLLAKQKDRRLGKYFETLWLFWLSHQSRYKVIEHNLQIIIDGETLGEIDLIVLDKKSGKCMHWELAIKFYLGVGDTTQMNNWHGPSLRDRLDLKVAHLQHRQSVITQDPRVQRWLQKRGIHIDSCAVILKGRLYYPQLVGSNGFSPKCCDPDHLRSCWFDTIQFEKTFDYEQRFMPLINQGWLEKIPTGSVKKTYSKQALFETLSTKTHRLPLHFMLCDLEHTRVGAFLTSFAWR